MTSQEIETLSCRMIDALGALAVQEVREGNIEVSLKLNAIMNETDSVTLAKLAKILMEA